MTKTVEDLRAEVQRQADALEQLRRNLAIAEREMEQLSPSQRLAITLHAKFCRHNHTDACDWYYNCKTIDGVSVVTNWNGHAQKEWVKKAEQLIAECATRGIKVEKFLEVMEAVKL